MHRYVLHAILAQLGFVPQGLIFPVSAVMLKVPRAYDEALESFSRRVMPRLAYEIARLERVINGAEEPVA